jgi:hypothetical protein
MAGHAAGLGQGRFTVSKGSAGTQRHERRQQQQIHFFHLKLQK